MVLLSSHQQIQHDKSEGEMRHWGGHGPHWRAKNLQGGFSNRGGGEELSHQVVSGMVGEAGGNDGTLPPPLCQGHRYNTGGRKHPPPTVRHSDVLEGSEWAACYHRSVCQGGEM